MLVTLPGRGRQHRVVEGLQAVGLEALVGEHRRDADRMALGELPRHVGRDHQLHQVDAELAVAAQQVVRPRRRVEAARRRLAPESARPGSRCSCRRCRTPSDRSASSGLYLQLTPNSGMKKLVLPLVALPSMPQPPVGCRPAARAGARGAAIGAEPAQAELPLAAEEAHRAGVDRAAEGLQRHGHGRAAHADRRSCRSRWRSSRRWPGPRCRRSSRHSGASAKRARCCNGGRSSSVSCGRLNDGIGRQAAGSVYQRASRRPLTTLDSQRRSGLLPFLMQSPLRTSKAHSCLGQVSVWPSSARCGMSVVWCGQRLS